MRRKALLWGALVALGAVTALIVATGAFGFDSPGQPTGTGTNTITWTGQGTTNGAIDTQQCDANNDAYLLWIFTSDHATLGSPDPVLTINGTDYTGFPHGNDWHFQTPYIDPSTITDAHVTFNVTALGGGNMNLTISHGCPGTSRPPAAAPTVSKDANGSFTNTFGWSIGKSADTNTVHSAGGGESGAVNYTVTVTHDAGTLSDIKVTGTITVTNNENAQISIDGITDQLSNGTSCDVTGGGSQTIAALGTAQATYECDLSALPDPATPLTNTATVAWSDQDLTDGTFLAGDTASFTTLPIDFTENDVDECVAVSDTIEGSLGTVCVGDANPTTFTYPVTFTGDPAGTCTSHDNTATFTTNDTGATDSASQTVQDCQGADLTVTKTAAGSFNRDYDWSVLKSQTTSSTPINSTASSVTVAYRVKATWSGPTDSGWQVTGTITVHNPNDWEAITLTGVTDAIDNGGTCVVAGDTTQTIAASSDSTGLTYTCTYASKPSPDAGTNTATATWDKAAASTPDGSNDGTAGVDFSTVTPTVTHNTTTVKDTFNGGAPLTLGVANVNGTFTKAAGNTLANWTQSYSAALKTFTFTYTRSVAVVPNTCTEYDNTATVSDDATNGDNSSRASVVVCGRVTGGLTIGFWSNNNGKAVLCTTTNYPKWARLLNGTWTTAPYNGGSYLRTAGGSLFTLTESNCNTADSNFAAWLLAASSTNASYMLSAQLAGTILNVNFNNMNGNLCIAGVGGTPISINNLIAAVITFLQANGNTTAAGPARTLAVQYQTILNNLNNGQGFVVPGSC